MPSYFDATEAVDKALLHDTVRDHDEAQAVADEVLDEIVEEFTQRGEPTISERNSTTTGLYWFTENYVYYTVHLWGYNPTVTSAAGYDADRAAWSGFAAALRKSVAMVTSHRLRHYDADPDVRQEQHGRESWSYGSSRDTRWPRGWQRPLRRYITKPPVIT